jgi:hypothetical protein
MGKVLERRPAPRFVERGDVRVARSLARCPYCHEGVASDAEAWVACRGCLARHHLACWSESGACSTCGRHDFLLASHVDPVQGWRRWAPALIGAVLAGGAGLVPCWLLGACAAWVACHVIGESLGCTFGFLVGVAAGLVCLHAGGWVGWKLSGR